MKLEIKKYVNMEAEAFKGKTDEEIYHLLSPSEINRVHAEYFLDRFEEIVNKAVEILKS